MIEKTIAVMKQVWFVGLCGLGGLLLSLLGLSIGWIIGSLLAACLLSYWQPKKLRMIRLQKGIHQNWRKLGQCLLGIELGKNMNRSVVAIFQENWLPILLVLFFSILICLVIGLALYRYSKADLLTSLFATSPGGVATMPAISDEIGANTGIVSAVQTLRILFVVSFIPIVLYYIGNGGNGDHHLPLIAQAHPPFSSIQLVWTIIFVLAALVGAVCGQWTKLPAPWLIGSIIGVFLLQTLAAPFTGHSLSFWWPALFVIIGQVIIGATIGSRLHKSMFVGLKQILIVSSTGTFFLIFTMFGCAYVVSKISGLSLVTTVLAFAPGGVVEMSTAAISLQADATFVVAVQTLRIVLVILLLPPLFRFVHKKIGNEKALGATDDHFVFRNTHEKNS